MKKTFIEEQQRFFQIMSIIDESFKEEHIKLLNEINYNRDEDIDYSQFERENELKILREQVDPIGYVIGR